MCVQVLHFEMLLCILAHRFLESDQNNWSLTYGAT